MIKGMTGYGASEVAWKQVKGSIEIKSQNHRYFDLVFYFPSGFSAQEEKVRQMIARDFTRGRVTVAFKMTEKPSLQHVLNKDAIKEYLRQARQLKKEFKVNDNLSLSDLIKLPGVVEEREISLDLQHFWPNFEKALKKALRSCLEMREREGKSLAADLNGILKRMYQRVQKIQDQARLLLAENKKKLTQDEFLSFQKGNDISEEIARLKHYIDEFGHLLKAEANVGKKLDFVAQEMQRETNTIGSKLQNTVVANAVISLKGNIEKLREQAQNIE